MNHKWRILHVSDLHYGALKANSPLLGDDDKQDTPIAARDKVINVFHELLTANPLSPLDAVAVTGDVADRGGDAGFATYATKTAALLKQLLSKGSSLCIVPGNHDVKWNLPVSQPDFFDEKFKLFKRYASQGGATTCLFPTGSLSNDQDEIAWESDGEPFFCDDARRLFILCINSAARCGEVNDARREAAMVGVEELRSLIAKPTGAQDQSQLNLAMAHLANVKLKIEQLTSFDVAHVTQSQRTHLSRILRKERDRVGKEAWRGYLRVALLHHHLVPFPEQVTEHKPFETVVDAALVLDVLGDYGFQLVLCGHKHYQYDMRYHTRTSDLLIVGGPTVGGAPARNHRQGIRLLEVEANDRLTEQLTVKLADIPILNQVADPDTYVSDCIQSARIVRVGAHRSAGGHCIDVEYCRRAVDVRDQIPQLDLRPVNATTDESSLFFLFLRSGLQSGITATVLFKYAMGQGLNPTAPRIEGIYDVFGEYDIVVKVRGGEATPHDPTAIISEIVKPLRKARLLGTSSEPDQWGDYLDVWNEKELPMSIFRFDPKLRVIRSFVYFRHIDNLTAVKNGCLSVVNGKSSVILSGFYAAREDVLAEYSVACGGYYELTDAVQAIEELGLARDKTTLNVMTIHEGDWKASLDELDAKINARHGVSPRRP